MSFKKTLINKPVSSPTKRGLFVPCSSSAPSEHAVDALKAAFRHAQPNMIWLRYATGNNKTRKERPQTFQDEKDIGSPEFVTAVNNYISNIKPISLVEKAKILKDTVGQASNPEWFRRRVGMMTASIFGKISKCYKPESIVKEVLYPSSKSKCEAVRYGRDNESIAVNAYDLFMRAFDKNVEITETGLHVFCQYPYIGASPDRVVFDGEGYGILEVKCPISKRGQTPEEACNDISFYCELVDGAISLKKKHNYYLQVQGQLALTGYSWCDFVIWTNNGSLSIGVHRIYFDEKLWTDSLLPSLHHFYKFAIVPEILSQRIKKHGKLYLPNDSLRYISFQAKRKGKDGLVKLK